MRHVINRFRGGISQRLAALSGMLLFSLLAGNAVAYTLNEASIDYRHPPGQRVDIGGYRLHIYCLGEGSPTVVFDSGIGGFSLEWVSIQAALAGYTRACIYDRAGYGWSDRSPYPRTTNVIVQELHRLLRAAHVPAPYLLVGHSFGGYNVRYFASEFPREVAGMVLVDSSHPQQFSAFPKPPEHKVKARPLPQRSYRVHILRPVYPRAYPAAVRQLAYMLMVRRRSAEIQLQELNHFEQSAKQVLQQADHFPDIPLIVLSRGKRVWPENNYGDAMERVWMYLQHDLLSLSRRSEQYIAMHSGHAIHLDQPQLVISSIMEDIRNARWDAARPNLVSGVNTGIQPVGQLPFEAVVSMNVYTYPRFTGP
jgi:pimeloyl-ACP methyl ester carboxylesterase